MNARSSLLNVLAAAMLASLSHTAAANTPVGNVVTGQVTSVAGGDHISINGHLYAVKASSPASDMLPRVKVGQTVDVVLDNSPGSSIAQVVVIHAH
jgi:hypothetical protein